MSNNFFKKRNFLVLSRTFLLVLFSKNLFANGNPYRDRFQSYRQTFRIEPNKDEAKRIINNIINGRTLSKGIINLKIPDTVEDGNVVPISFSINSGMTDKDYPKKVHILGMENPFPEIATYEFFPYTGKAEVSFRCRLRKSSSLVVIAEMNDGRIALEEKYVDVMLGACSWNERIEKIKI